MSKSQKQKWASALRRNLRTRTTTYCTLQGSTAAVSMLHMPPMPHRFEPQQAWYVNRRALVDFTSFADLFRYPSQGPPSSRAPASLLVIQLQICENRYKNASVQY